MQCYVPRGGGGKWAGDHTHVMVHVVYLVSYPAHCHHQPPGHPVGERTRNATLPSMDDGGGGAMAVLWDGMVCCERYCVGRSALVVAVGAQETVRGHPPAVAGAACGRTAECVAALTSVRGYSSNKKA